MTNEHIRRHLEKMREDWNQWAHENARYYVHTGKEDWSEEEFYSTGESNLKEYVLNDLTNICQGRAPQEMKVLEIGCGPGRITRALAGFFGEVYAVDISEEMVRQARLTLKSFPQAHVFVNNGHDLAVIRESCQSSFGPGEKAEFDFAFSYLVFQHIPSREIIENYVREVHGLLKPGALFKFQVQGMVEKPGDEHDTWVGVPFSERQAGEMAERCGFEMRYNHGAGDQYYWLWFFKKTEG